MDGVAETGTRPTLKCQMSQKHSAICLHSPSVSLKIYNDTITVITSTCSPIVKTLSPLNEQQVTLINPDHL